MTKREACEKWVTECMDAIPTEMFSQWVCSYGINNDPSFSELTVFDEDEEPDSEFPMWGTMWSFNRSYEEEKIYDVIKEMSDIGFRIYDTEHGVFFGIDGAGYDFYEEHWVPLYDLFSMHWHNDEDKQA